MSLILFTVSGCGRCRFVKKFLDERQVSYQERNVKLDGAEEFRDFYKRNRHLIVRSSEGIQFPILTDGQWIKQTIGPIISWAMGDPDLEAFFAPGLAHGQWIDGISVSSGDWRLCESFLEILLYLKSHSFKLQLNSWGKNAAILERMLEQDIPDRMVMEVNPLFSMPQSPSEDLGKGDEIRLSIALTPRFKEYWFQTVISPIPVKNSSAQQYRWPTLEEIARAAKLVEDITGNKKHPYFLVPWSPNSNVAPERADLKPLGKGELLRYRAAVRTHQVFAEITELPIYKFSQGETR